MSKNRFKNILLKYLNNQALEIEVEELLEWLKDEKNLKLFNDYIAVDHFLNIKYKNVDSVKSYQKTIAKFDRKRKWYYKYAVAASVLLLVALTVFIHNNDKLEFIEPIIVNNTIKIGTDKATLTLDDGSQVDLVKGTAFKKFNLSSNGEEIIYQGGKPNKNEIAYNYLTIPRGGQFFVKLADGTKVWLNSESQLKYPTQFIEGETREVELVYGEAYFSVSSSTENKGAAFKILNQDQEVEVLGTEFNIKAYKDESQIHTTLVEGKVAVSTNKISKILSPNQQSTLDIKTQKLLVSTVDVSSEVSWKNGVFKFKGKSLKEIMKVLSRWYDMDVVFINKDAEDLKFIGTLYKRQSIEEILFFIKSTNLINNYRINNKTIILN